MFDDGQFLPGGDHDASWLEVEARFGRGARREVLYRQLGQYILQARLCGFLSVYLFGSFISSKPEPGDVDLLWVYRSDTFDDLGLACRELLNYEIMKGRVNWDMFCCSDDPGAVEYLLPGFRKTKDRSRERGIIRIDLQRFEGLVI